MLSEINDLGEGLDEWEINFVKSVTEHQKSSLGYSLTKPQMVKIENIHKRRVP